MGGGWWLELERPSSAARRLRASSKRPSIAGRLRERLKLLERLNSAAVTFGGRSRPVSVAWVAASTSEALKPHRSRDPRPPGSEAGSWPTSCRPPGSGAVPRIAPLGARRAAPAPPAARAASGASRTASNACVAQVASAVTPRCRTWFSACSLGQIQRYREIRRSGGGYRLSNRLVAAPLTEPLKTKKAPLQPV